MTTIHATNFRRDDTVYRNGEYNVETLCRSSVDDRGLKIPMSSCYFINICLAADVEDIDSIPRKLIRRF
jgi:hypothetical protein